MSELSDWIGDIYWSTRKKPKVAAVKKAKEVLDCAGFKTTTDEKKRIERNKVRLAAFPDGLYCYYCTERLTPVTYTIDHVIPLSKGGRNTQINKVYSCMKCNREKGDSLDKNKWFKGCKAQSAGNQ